MYILGALGTGALATSSAAQSAGQAIIFSTPQTEAGQHLQPAPEPVNAPSGILPGAFQAPTSIFDFNPPNDALPLPVSSGISVQQQQRMQKLLKDRKNWIFMTPQEILGTPVTENLLQPPERDALGREKNPTALERFLQRESRQRNGLTNGWPDNRTYSQGDWVRNSDNEPRRDEKGNRAVENARAMSQLLGNQPNQNDAGGQTENSSWEAFSQTTPLAVTRPDPEQQAAMDRFRQLLNAGPAQTVQPSDTGLFASPPADSVDPFLTRPDFLPNPAGASFTPISSGIARPAGLTPLPDAVPGLSPSADALSSKLQPAPWLQTGPQPFVMPQRKGF